MFRDVACPFAFSVACLVSRAMLRQLYQTSVSRIDGDWFASKLDGLDAARLGMEPESLRSGKNKKIEKKGGKRERERRIWRHARTFIFAGSFYLFMANSVPDPRPCRHFSSPCRDNFVTREPAALFASATLASLRVPRNKFINKRSEGSERSSSVTPPRAVSVGRNSDS